MKDLYQKIENYFKFEKSDTVAVSLFKSLVLLVSGGYFGVILREINSTPQVVNFKHILIVLVGISVGYFLEYRKLKKEKNFPVTILEHLNAREDLKELQEKYSRITKVYGYIDRSIQSLNTNTCPVVSLQENTLCQQDLQEGLKSVLYDLVKRPNYFFNIDKTQFSIGIHLEEVWEKDNSSGSINSSEKNFLFRDDLQFSNYIPFPLSSITANKDLPFQIQAGVIESQKLGKYLCKKITHKAKTYTFVCSPIPNVCEDCPADGVIYTIYEGDECCSSDSENVLLIFGRILSNWISKYNECVAKSKTLLQPLATISVPVESPIVSSSIKH